MRKKFSSFSALGYVDANAVWSSELQEENKVLLQNEGFRIHSCGEITRVDKRYPREIDYIFTRNMQI